MSHTRIGRSRATGILYRVTDTPTLDETLSDPFVAPDGTVRIVEASLDGLTRWSQRRPRNLLPPPVDRRARLPRLPAVRPGEVAPGRVGGAGPAPAV